MRFGCGEEPLLRCVAAGDLAVDEQRAAALARLDELVVNCAQGGGGKEVWILRASGVGACAGNLTDEEGPSGSRCPAAPCEGMVE